MDFVRIKEDLIRLDMVTRIREGRSDETYYGRSVRKGTAGWLELHFIDGEVMKLEGDAADMLRHYLETEQKIKDLNPPPVNGGGAGVPFNGVRHPPHVAR